MDTEYHLLVYVTIYLTCIMHFIILRQGYLRFVNFKNLTRKSVRHWITVVLPKITLYTTTYFYPKCDMNSITINRVDLVVDPYSKVTS